MRRLRVGVRRHPFRLPLESFLGYSVLWTALESANFFFPGLKPAGWVPFLVMAAASGAYGFYRFLPRTEVHLRFKALNTTAHVGFGDLFAADGYKVIPVNEYFDSDLGEHVSNRSLHGQLIEKYLAGQSSAFDSIVDAALSNVQAEEVQRPTGRTRCYPIGTTVLMDLSTQHFLLIANCHTDVKTLKATSDVPTMWTALISMWEAIRNRTDGNPVCVPLIGSGHAAMGLPSGQLLQLLILSLVVATKAKPIPNELRIVLHENCIDDIDLGAVKTQWDGS